MNQKIWSGAMFAATIAFVLVSCNDTGSNDESAAADSAAAVTVPATASIPNAVVAAPDLYKVLADTAGIRMIDATYKPGDSSVMHSHHDYAVYSISAGNGEFTLPDGTKDVREMTTGTARVIAADAHSIKNIGNTNLSVIMVEVDRPSSIAAADAAMDATKVGGDKYKVLADSLGMRVLMATYQAGQSSAMHAHAWQAVYPITDGKGEFTDKDGKKMTIEMKAGQAMIVPPTTHSVKNTGKAAMKVLIVEVSRAEK